MTAEYIKQELIELKEKAMSLIKDREYGDGDTYPYITDPDDSENVFPVVRIEKFDITVRGYFDELYTYNYQDINIEDLLSIIYLQSYEQAHNNKSI
jgi:hypothetical protein